MRGRRRRAEPFKIPAGTARLETVGWQACRKEDVGCAGQSARETWCRALGQVGVVSPSANGAAEGDAGGGGAGACGGDASFGGAAVVADAGEVGGVPGDAGFLGADDEALLPAGDAGERDRGFALVEEFVCLCIGA